MVLTFSKGCSISVDFHGIDNFQQFPLHWNWIKEEDLTHNIQNFTHYDTLQPYSVRWVDVPGEKLSVQLLIWGYSTGIGHVFSNFGILKGIIKGEVQ